MYEKTAGGAAMASPVNFMEIWRTLWERRVVIVLCAALAMVFTYAKIGFFTDDVYTSNGKLYVSSTDRNAMIQSAGGSVDGSDVSDSRLISTTYIEMLTTRSFLTEVSDYLQNGYSWADIDGMVSISAVNGTEIIKVSVQSGSPVEAYTIANAVMSCAPARLNAIFGGGRVEIVDSALYPESPDDKSLGRFLMLNTILGFCAGCVISLMLDYLDDKIRRSEDVAERYNVPVLGEISQ